MKAINLIFPHQLFKSSPLLENDDDIYLVEEHLFFKHYAFHKQKIAFHRASMKAYQAHLEGLNKTVRYIDSSDVLSDIREFHKEIADKKMTHIHFIDPVDDWLEQRLRETAKAIQLTMHDSPQFLNSKKDLQPFFRADKKSFFQTTFYKQQRKRFDILLDAEGKPEGGKWTYDADNRKKYPKDKPPPAV